MLFPQMSSMVCIDLRKVVHSSEVEGHPMFHLEGLGVLGVEQRSTTDGVLYLGQMLVLFWSHWTRATPYGLATSKHFVGFF